MGKHGGKAHTPVMLNDNLKSKQFYRVIDLISEGPIFGPVDQTAGSSFLVNNTPITDANGNVNIPGIAVAWREGSGNQTPINGLNFIEATHMVALDVTHSTPIIRTINDPDVSRVRLNLGVSALVQTSSKGDQSNASVQLEIATRSAGGSWLSAKTVTITGKISGEYLEAHVIDAPASKPFDIRVSRVTADSTVDTLQNGTVWNSYTEITDDSLSYPYSAVAGAIIDHDQYSDTPSRTYHLKGLIVDVPDNYDPEKRTYSGIWRGGWKQEYTNNPAWLFRELVKNDRFGLTKAAGYIDVDDGALYVLSQYCDQMVPTGYGNAQEPRLTLNAYITEQTTARELLDKIAGMFRGFALWDGMRLTVLLDNPADPIAAITNANVIDGSFTYSSMKRSERYNAVVVSWTDPENGWKQSKEYVSDDTLIARYGYNETTLEAFGCTSRGQAYRAGKWLLETARRETKRVRFQMARDAIAFMPGDIVEVMDNNYAGARFGGRIMSHTANSITVDAPVSSTVAVGDTVGLMNASGRLEHHKIASVSGTTINLQSTPARIIDGTVFAISAAKTSTRLFRIMGIEETENNSVYTINAHQHDPHKQAVVDEGAVFEAPNDTLNGFRVPAIENLHVIDVNSETVQVEAQWETATTTRGMTFEVVVYDQTGKKIVNRWKTTDYSLPIYGLNAGHYQLGVRAINQMGMRGPETMIPMGIGRPPKPESIRWDKGIFSATIVPLMGMNFTSDVTYEYWFGEEHKASSNANITIETNFVGRGPQWTVHGLKASTTYYMYVRTRNGFGVSDFVEVSGEASGDIPGMIQFIDDAVRASNEFAILTAGVKDNKDEIAKIDQEVNQVRTDWTAAETSLNTTVSGMTTQVAAIDKTAKDALALVGQTKTDLEAQISAITGGGNSTFTGLVNDVKQVKTDQATQLTQIQAATTRMDGIDATVAGQTALWRADDAVIATSVSQVKATADKAASDITTEQQARADGDAAVAKRIDTMVSGAPADQTDPDRQALILAITSTESDHDKSLATQVNQMSTTVNGFDAKIQSEATARSDGDKAMATRIDNMVAGTGKDGQALIQQISDVTDAGFAAAATDRRRLETAIGTNAAAINSEQTARSNADSAITQRIDRMVSSTDNPDKRALVGVITTTITDPTGATAKRLAQLEAADSGFVTRIDAVEKAVSSPTGSTATRLTNLEAFQTAITTNGAKADKTTNDAIKAVDQKATGAVNTANGFATRISTLETAGAKPDSATAQRISTLETKLAPTGLPKDIADAKKAGTDAATAAATAQAKANTAASDLTKAVARITTIETSGAKPNAATATRLTNLESGVNGIAAKVQTEVSTKVNALGLSSQWGIKTAVTTNGHYYAAGIQLGITGTPSKVESNFIVNADTFSVYNTKNGKMDFCFGTTNGQTFIKSAFIQDASITMGKIQDQLQSAGYATGAGWALNSKTNAFTIKTANTGQRVVIDANGLSVYDAKNVLRVRVGKW